ncbi:hypothetical protein TKWG_20635 [Advenella kashmirensis WT001]|uniref:Uncharacterized protein n=1 Tax=Advenella kashmirensis (strain DSM 17095 / LMG 22695 / WT001) TaxID=1036672 RepID=I3UFS3_ADVKW|nr:hypothetical protein TKWG_20635 [Advenella kashmirensis WT001]
MGLYIVKICVEQGYLPYDAQPATCDGKTNFAAALPGYLQAISRVSPGHYHALAAPAAEVDKARHRVTGQRVTAVTPF